MRRTGIATGTLMLALAASFALLGGEETSGRGVAAAEALIIRERVIPANGVGKVSALRIVEPGKLSALEAHFPNCRERPSSDLAGAWEAGYRVYLTFLNGETVRITVSADESGRFWTTGHGDFSTKGDFVKFVEQLGL